MRIAKEKLTDAARQIVEKSGTAPEDALIVAEELVCADMMGMNSHGVLRLPQYLEDAERGNLNPAGEVKIVRETAATALVDGGLTYGVIVGRKLADIVAEKAKKTGIACGLSCNTRHPGRIGSFVQQIADKGLIGYSVAGVYQISPMAPFGALDSRLSTNPIAWASPRPASRPVFVDISTTVVAEGKIRSYILEGKEIPLGWVRDADGNDTTDPKALYGPPRGTIYPLGGSIAGNKGSGLAIMADMMTIALCNDDYWKDHEQGIIPKKEGSYFIMAVDPDFFCGRDAYMAQVEEHCRYLKSARPAEGFDEVLLPGEFEYKNYDEALENGVHIADDTWANLLVLGRKMGCAFAADAEVPEELHNAFRF